MNSFKSKFLMFFAVTSAIVIAVVFFITYKSYYKLENIKPKVEAQFSEWAKNNECQKDANNVCGEYDKAVKDYLQQLEQIKQRREIKPEYQVLIFFKDLDKEYFSEISQAVINNDFVKDIDEKYLDQIVTGDLFSGSGCVSFVVCLILYLSLAFIIAKMLSSSSSSSSYSSSPVRKKPQIKFAPKISKKAKADSSNDIYSLLSQSSPDRKALAEAIQSVRLKKVTEWLEIGAKIDKLEMPELAVQCFEKGLAGNLSPKLMEATMLICAALQVKHNIAAERGKQRLVKLAESSQASISKRAEDALFLLNK